MCLERSDFLLTKFELGFSTLILDLSCTLNYFITKISFLPFWSWKTLATHHLALLCFQLNKLQVFMSLDVHLSKKWKPMQNLDEHEFYLTINKQFKLKLNICTELQLQERWTTSCVSLIHTFHTGTDMYLSKHCFWKSSRFGGEGHVFFSHYVTKYTTVSFSGSPSLCRDSLKDIHTLAFNQHMKTLLKRFLKFFPCL